LTQASRNANDGISLAQTAEGALGEINTNLQRIRELAVQSLNGTNSTTDKASMQAEITQRFSEIDRTATQTDFNGTKILSTAATAIKVQVGSNDGDTIAINLGDMKSTALFVGSAVSGATTDVTAPTTTMLTDIDKAIKVVDDQRSSLGAVQNRFDSVISNLGTTINNLTSSRSRIEDANYATEVSNMSRSQILQKAGTSVLAQANQSSQGVLSLLQ
jgi:flagellin